MENNNFRLEGTYRPRKSYSSPFVAWAKLRFISGRVAKCSAFPLIRFRPSPPPETYFCSEKIVFLMLDATIDLCIYCTICHNDQNQLIKHIKIMGRGRFPQMAWGGRRLYLPLPSDFVSAIIVNRLSICQTTGPNGL